MAILPFGNSSTNYDIVQVTYPTDSYLINEDTKTVSLSKDYRALMHQTIDTILRVNRYSYVIYPTNNVGWLFVDLAGSDLSLVYAVSQTRIRNALSIDERIIDVVNFDYNINDKKSMTIYFTVNTIYGNIEKEVNVSI